MKAISKFSVTVLLLLLFVLTTTNASQAHQRMTKRRAVILAQQFVIDNGYTLLPADKSKLSYELLDRYTSNTDSLLKRRYNTLHPKAFYYSESDKGWDIGFLSAEVDLNKLDSLEEHTDLSGRAVIVSKNGKEIRIAHKDPRFSQFFKL